MSIFDGLLGAGVSAFGSFMGQESANVQNAEQAEMNRAFQGAQSQAQMNFQERMSNTAYQRATADMKAAGLNPMLAYMKGGAEGAPGASGKGAQAVMGSSLGAAVNSGQTGAMLSATVENIRANTVKAGADAKLADSQALINAVQVPNVEQQTKTGTFTAANLEQQTRQSGYQITKLMAEVEQLVHKTDLTFQQIKLVKEEVINAVKEGRRIDAQTGNLKVDTALSNLELPLARNLARAQESTYMQEVSPYVRDVVRGTSSARDLRNIARPTMRSRR